MVKKNPGANINRRGQTFSLYDYYLNPEKYADQVDSQTNTDNVFNQGNDNVQTYAEFPTTGSNDGLTYQGTPGGNTGSGLFDLIDNSGKDFGPYTKTSMAPQTSTVSYDQQDDIRQNFGRGLTDEVTKNPNIIRMSNFNEMFGPKTFTDSTGQVRTTKGEDRFSFPNDVAQNDLPSNLSANTGKNNIQDQGFFESLLNLGPGINATSAKGGTLAGDYGNAFDYLGDDDEFDNFVAQDMAKKGSAVKSTTPKTTTFSISKNPSTATAAYDAYLASQPKPKTSAISTGIGNLFENTLIGKAATTLGGMLPQDTPQQKFDRNYRPTNDIGQVSTDPTKDVFGGANSVSTFGSLENYAQKRIDTIDKALAKMTPTQLAKTSLVDRKNTFQQQLDEKKSIDQGRRTAAAAAEPDTGMGSCFIAGTKVRMADGTNKNIENIKVGDKVKGHKEDNIVIKLDPTLLGNRKLYSFNDNDHYFFTSEHPFMTEEGWKSIKPEKTKERDGVELYEQLKGELKIGDKLITEDDPIEITSIKSKEMNQPDMPLYNFNVSNDNSYIADKHVVHNKGGSPGCFIKGTLITMTDGSTKPVEQVDLGDEVAEGGSVFAVGRFLNTELYDYKGIKVSGSHMVNEDGVWMRVRDTKNGKSLGDDENTVYVFGCENRRILINGILFTDYFEIQDQEQLLKEEDKFFDNWKTFANNEDQKNVDRLNAV